MYLIVESGSTTTIWILLDQGKIIKQWESLGLNPVSQSAHNIHKYLTIALEELKNPRSIKQLDYYGAGCTPPYDYKMQTLLQTYFSNATITVDSDLQAAVFASCKGVSGLIGILGTGSNLCYYDGEKIHQRTPALGYVLGDEGSGSHLGKTLLRHYLYRQLPKEIHEALQREYLLSKSDILDQVYRTPNPKRFLADFAKFLHKYRHNPHINQLIKDCFRDYIRNHLSKFEDKKALPVHFIGSIAFYFKPILETCIREEGFLMGAVFKTAVEGVVSKALGND